MAGGDHVEPVVFGPAMEGLKKALGKRFTPELKASLLQQGIDFDHIQVAYALETWLAAIRQIADALGTEVAPAERYRHLGRLFMRGFVETPIGFASLTAGRIMGVKRTLLRMGRNFRTAANYIESEERDLGPKELSIRTFVSDRFLPKMKDTSRIFVEYRHGVLEAVLEALGARGTVEIIHADLQRYDFTYRISWE